MKSLCLRLLLSFLACFGLVQAKVFDEASTALEQEIIDLHRDLVKIESITGGPEGTASADKDERHVVHFVEQWFEKQKTAHGLELNIFKQTVTKGRENIFIYAGPTKQAKVLLTSHMDTVAPYVPYELKGEKIYGRGTNDDKGSMAAQMIAFRDLFRDEKVKPGDLALLFVVGEEVGGTGMKMVNKLGIKWKAVVFGEPTDNKLATGQIGGLVFNITARGKAAHSSTPHLGINAIKLTRQCEHAVEEVVKKLPTMHKYGKNSVTIAQQGGGQADNAVPANAWISGSFRLTVSPEKVVQRLGPLITQYLCPNKEPHRQPALEQPCSFIDIKYPLREDPLDIDHDIPGIEKFSAQFGSDISMLKGHHQKFLYGPGSILTAHQEREFVPTSELIEAVSGYKKIVEHVLNSNTSPSKGKGKPTQKPAQKPWHK